MGDSNVFLDGRGDLYLIDVGCGNIADRWPDSAFMHRELRESISERMAANFLAHLCQPDAPDKRMFLSSSTSCFEAIVVG